jgi:hypothetical protein
MVLSLPDLRMVTAGFSVEDCWPSARHLDTRSP